MNCGSNMNYNSVTQVEISRCNNITVIMDRQQTNDRASRGPRKVNDAGTITLPHIRKIKQ